ncbi:MAG: CopG family transcriptional regulator [Candidatus Dojkabacteria bacterium]
MYTTRTNVLLSENMYSTLKHLAAQKKVSIGKLIREAVEQKYMHNEAERRMQVKEKTEKYRVQLKGKVNYKKLVEEGRKY